MSERIAVMLDKDNSPVIDKRTGAMVCARMPHSGLSKTAHVSGNQIDVFHCPFCGSGAVVARSDMSIECSFCNSAFTVTISPQFPAFPMSVDGQPYPWPGRPDGGMDPSMMGGDPNAMADDGSGYGGQLIPGGGAGAAASGDDGDGDGNPFADDGGGDDGGDSGDAPPSSDGKGDKDKEAEVGGKKKPPFGKKSVLVTGGIYGHYPMYRTVSGAKLPEREYMRHLAISTARDPNAMAVRIREERRA